MTGASKGDVYARVKNDPAAVFCVGRAANRADSVGLLWRADALARSHSANFGSPRIIWASWRLDTCPLRMHSSKSLYPTSRSLLGMAYSTQVWSPSWCKECGRKVNVPFTVCHMHAQCGSARSAREYIPTWCGDALSVAPSVKGSEYASQLRPTLSTSVSSRSLRSVEASAGLAIQVSRCSRARARHGAPPGISAAIAAVLKAPVWEYQHRRGYSVGTQWRQASCPYQSKGECYSELAPLSSPAPGSPRRSHSFWRW